MASRAGAIDPAGRIFYNQAAPGPKSAAPRGSRRAGHGPAIGQGPKVAASQRGSPGRRRGRWNSGRGTLKMRAIPVREPLATHQHQPDGLADTLEFLKRTRNELRMLRKTRVWTDRVQIFDVNGDYFQVDGVGYPDADVTAVLSAVNTAFKPEMIHQPIDAPYKEFKTGRRHPWAEDRVM